MSEEYGIMTPRGWVTSFGFIQSYPTRELALENAPEGGIPVKIEKEGFWVGHDELRRRADAKR